MKRERLLIRQGGQRHLGLNSFNEDVVGAYLRLKNSPVKRHREYAAKFLLESEAMRDHNGQTNNSKARECVTKTLQIIEHDWTPAKDDDECSFSSAMPSLASINPGSVAGESCSWHSSSRSGLSKFSSMTSSSSYCYSYETDDNISITSHSMVSEPTLRQTMRVLLLEDINEEGRAETLDCLEPVIVSSRQSSRSEKTRWGSPPCDNEITVCRPEEHFEGSAPISVPGRHELASRNADEAPCLPPRVNRVLPVDQSPIIPRRSLARQEYQPPTPPSGLERWKSLDQMPFQPRRKDSSSRSCS